MKLKFIYLLDFIKRTFQLGVRTSENKHTSPVLCVHLQRHSRFDADIAKNNRTIVVAGTKNQDFQGPQQTKSEDTYAAEEEIIMIPVEDVTEITSKLETTKGKQEDRKSEVTPVHKISENDCDRCCDKILSCCRKVRDCCCFCCQEDAKVAPLVSNTITIVNRDDLNRTTRVLEEDLPVPKQDDDICDCLRCWCCRKKKLIRLIKRTNIVAEQQAQRVVTMTIGYSQYSNLDSASNARLLSEEQRAAYYKEKFEPNAKLEFHLISDRDIDGSNFKKRKVEAEVLSRTVLHLRAMRNHYPSEIELEDILNQTHQRAFGDMHEEPTV